MPPLIVVAVITDPLIEMVDIWVIGCPVSALTRWTPAARRLCLRAVEGARADLEHEANDEAREVRDRRRDLAACHRAVDVVPFVRARVEPRHHGLLPGGGCRGGEAEGRGGGEL